MPKSKEPKGQRRPLPSISSRKKEKYSFRYSLLPASFVLGTAASALWASKCTYLTETGIRYAFLNVESANVVIVRFFGIFFMIVHLGQVFGNVISSWILSLTMEPHSLPLPDKVDATCGHFFRHNTNLSREAERNLRRPMVRAYRSVCGIYFGCVLAAVMILACFLNSLRKDTVVRSRKPTCSLDVCQRSLGALRQVRVLLLVPLTIFNGMEQAFIAGEFTKAYVGCCLGVSSIGYVMTAFGVADALCSLVFGPLIKLFGRMPLLMFAAVVDLLMILAMLIWPPNPADTAIFYVFAASWGMADGVWNTQINGLWVVLMRGELETAFASYRLWESVGLLIGFGTGPLLHTEDKLRLLLVALLTGVAGYALIELWHPLTAKLEELAAEWGRVARKVREGGGSASPESVSLKEFPPPKPLFSIA